MEEFSSGLEQTSLLYAVNGGLRGRFAQSFCVLQTSLDALERCLDERADPQLRQRMKPLIREMAAQLPGLERLSDHVADLALGNALHEVYEQEPVELVSHLKRVCESVNAECAQREIKVEIVLELADGVGPCLTVSGNSGLIEAMLANLVSNSLAERKENVRITLSLSGDRRLIYHDGGEGFPENAWGLLTEGRWTEELLSRGATGLLLVRNYCETMGWKISRAEDGVGVVFQMPPCDRIADTLYSDPVWELVEGERCRNCFGRELDAMLLRTGR